MELRKKNLSLISAIILLNSVVSCYSDSIELLQKRQFELQTQILNLNKQDKKNNLSTSKQNKKVANIYSDFDSFLSELTYIKGEIDLLKKGFELGRLPNVSQDAYSIDSRINILNKRLKLVEKTQRDILDTLEIIEKNIRQSYKKTRKKIKNLKQTKLAFEEKRFMHIIIDLPGIIKNKKNHSLWNLRYYYAESLFKVGRLHHAAMAFKELEEKDSLDKQKKPTVKLRLGDCFRHLGDKKTALVYYGELLEQYPRSKEAEFAQKYLDKI